MAKSTQFTLYVVPEDESDEILSNLFYKATLRGRIIPFNPPGQPELESDDGTVFIKGHENIARFLRQHSTQTSDILPAG